MHKFYLGQAVEYHAPCILYAPRGPYIVTVKLPERDGQLEYRIRSPKETHERIAQESDPRALPEKKEIAAVLR
jgi:hypothetical protein